MKKVLVVVDLQKEFGLVVDNEKYYEILDFVNHAKENGYDKVIGTVCKNRADSNFVKSGIWLDCVDKVEPLEFTPDITIDKYGYGLDSIKYSKMNKKYEYHIIGYNTDACVLKVALDMFDRGFNVRVLIDKCYSSMGKEQHEIGVKILKDLMGNYVV